MNIKIDYNKRLPIYEQIVEEVEKQISLEILRPGNQILSIRELAIVLSINPNTVKKAYDILEQKGLIVSKSTKGTFIAEQIKQAKNLKIDELLSEIKLKIKELKVYGLNLEEIIKRID